MAWTNVLGQIRVGVRNRSQVQTPTNILDTYSGAATAYSLRKLSGTYTGSAIRVRRSSDNTEMNIGFTAGGDLNTVALLSFVGTGNGFVTTWYDQIGSNNLTQLTSVSQPKIVSSGSVITLNNKPTISFGTQNDFWYLESPNNFFSLTPSPISIFGVWKITDYSNSNAGVFGPSDYFGKGIEILQVSTISRRTALRLNGDGNAGGNWGMRNDNSGDAYQLWDNSTHTLNSFLFKSDSVSVYKNTTAVSLTNGSGISSLTAVQKYALGRYASTANGNFYSYMDCQELLFYTNDQSTNRISISTNINSYYSIYASDSDAQAFITAAGITDTTQKNAINKLVTDLKAANIWTKMKALYPFVGGSANSHKFNLKDPRDVDAAFRLQFNGGWTHTSTGATPNGSNGYADTKFVPSSNLSSSSAHQFFYFRNSTLSMTRHVTHGCVNPWGNNFILYSYAYNIGWISDIYDYSQSRIYSNFGNSSGAILSTRSSLSSHKLFRNNSQIAATTNSSNASIPSINYYIGALNNNGSIIDYDWNEISFTSLGDGLTDSEAAAFYTAVETFQTTLGRNVGVPIVSDSDAQAFINSAQITNSTQANAVNTLVTSLKGYGLWSKMRAIYPFVGGNENAHKYNLKDPRDLDAAYRLQFYGGMTHDSRGIIPNGSSYADTKLNTNILSMTNTSFSIYVGSTDRIGSVPYPVDLGVFTADYSGRYGLSLATSDGNSYFDVYNRSTIPNSNLGSGFVQYSRTSTSLAKVYYKNTYTHTNTSSTSQYSNPNSTIYLSTLHIGTTIESPSIRVQSFSTIGDGLTDTEAANLYTVVQAFQTTLGRAI